AVNPMNKQRELSYLLEDSGAIALLTLEDLFHDVAQEVLAGGTTAVRTVITTSALDFQGRDDPRVFDGVTRRRAEGTLSLTDIIASHDGSRGPAPTLGSDDVAVLT